MLEAQSEGLEGEYQIVSDKKHCFPLRPYLIWKNQYEAASVVWKGFQINATQTQKCETQTKLCSSHLWFCLYSLKYWLWTIIFLFVVFWSLKWVKSSFSDLPCLPLLCCIELIYSVSLTHKMRWKAIFAIHLPWVVLLHPSTRTHQSITAWNINMGSSSFCCFTSQS